MRLHVSRQDVNLKVFADTLDLTCIKCQDSHISPLLSQSIDEWLMSPTPDCHWGTRWKAQCVIPGRPDWTSVCNSAGTTLNLWCFSTQCCEAKRDPVSTFFEKKKLRRWCFKKMSRIENVAGLEVRHALAAKLPFNCTKLETQFKSRRAAMHPENSRHQPDEHFMFFRFVIPNLTEAW